MRRLNTRHGNRRRDDRGENGTNYPRPYGVSRCPWKPVANAGTWLFQKRGLFPRCVEETPAYIFASIPCPSSLFLSLILLSSSLLSSPLSCFPTTRRRLIRGINSARVTKNRRGETASRFTMSLFPSRGIPRRYLFSAVLREISPRFPRFRSISSEAGANIFMFFYFRKNLISI